MMINSGKAIKKPIEIDWFEWNGDIKALEEWHVSFGTIIEGAIDFIFDVTDKTLKVNTLEGHSYDVPLGYIIIKGVEGEYYPCDPKIFNKTYIING